MIHAYAIEPECVVKWCDLRSFRMIVKEFGLGTPRMLLEFPKFSSWKKDVFVAISQAGLSDLDQTRLTELVLHLGERRVRRANRQYDGKRPWLENAEDAYADRPFSAIVAMENPRNHAAVLKEPQVGDGSNSLWARPMAATPPRTPKGICDVLSALIENCDEIHMVDPHFDPKEIRFYGVLNTILKHCESRANTPSKICVHCRNEVEDKYSKQFFEETVAKNVSGAAHFSLSFKRWKERFHGEKFHNRYVLTDIGGVVLGTGLDSGDPEQTDDINLMDKKQFQKRWEQYNGATESVRAFDLVDEPQYRRIESSHGCAKHRRFRKGKK